MSASSKNTLKKATKEMATKTINIQYIIEALNLAFSVKEGTVRFDILVGDDERYYDNPQMRMRKFVR